MSDYDGFELESIADVDDRHGEVSVNSAAWHDPDGPAVDGRALVLARRRAAGTLARIALILLPEVEAARTAHGCGSPGLRWTRTDYGGWQTVDGCALGFDQAQALAPATSAWNDCSGLWLTVPAEDTAKWMARVRTLLDVVARDDAATPPRLPAGAPPTRYVSTTPTHEENPR